MREGGERMREGGEIMREGVERMREEGMVPISVGSSKIFITFLKCFNVPVYYSSTV